METTSLGFGVILGSYWDNGKEDGNYYSILGLYTLQHSGIRTHGLVAKI